MFRLEPKTLGAKNGGVNMFNHHWTERGRASSVSNSEVTDRPRRSVRWARQGKRDIPIHPSSSRRRRWLAVVGRGPGEFWQRNGGKGMTPRRHHSFASIPLPFPRSAKDAGSPPRGPFGAQQTGCAESRNRAAVACLVPLARDR
jgi:hypothetical protein